MKFGVFCKVALLGLCLVKFNEADPIDQCTRKAGRCIPKTNCSEPIKYEGLCSTKGDECCIEGRGPRCSDLGGECIPRCIIPSGPLNQKRDCPEKLSCCIWVRFQ